MGGTQSVHGPNRGESLSVALPLKKHLLKWIARLSSALLVLPPCVDQSPFTDKTICKMRRGIYLQVAAACKRRSAAAAPMLANPTRRAASTVRGAAPTANSIGSGLSSSRNARRGLCSSSPPSASPSPPPPSPPPPAMKFGPPKGGHALLHFGNTCALLSFSMTDVFFLRSLALVATTCGGEYAFYDGKRRRGRAGKKSEHGPVW